MIKRLMFSLFLLVFIFQNLIAQTYVLNEDFSASSGTTPPNQWQNYSNTSIPTDLWHFNNPGNQSIGFPFSGNFAIFDSPITSDNFQPEESILESAVFDATNGSYVFLFFDTYFTGANGDTGLVELYDGSAWQIIRQYTSSMPGVLSESINVTSVLANVSNAKIRFRWKGDGLHFWAVDNISVFIPINTDVGILNLTSPQMPFVASILDIKINVKNFGGQNVSVFTLNWTTNGVLQSPVQWNGNLSFSEQLNNLLLGGYSFNPGKPVHLKIWVTLSTPLLDLNHSNDTLNITVTPSFCGTYTIGGSNPDFTDFTDLSGYLNDAGVACATTFLVRDGTYQEQFELFDIPGSSNVNTIIFRGENLSSSTATIIFGYSILNYLISVNHCSWITFEYLTLKRTAAGSTAVYITNSSGHITFSNCTIVSYYGIYFVGGSDFVIDGCLFDGSNSYMGVGVSATSSPSQPIEGLTISNSSFLETQNKAVNFNYVNDIEIVNNDIEDYVKTAVFIGNANQGLIKQNTMDSGERPIEFQNSAMLDVIMNTITGFTYPAVSSSGGNSTILIGENVMTGSESLSAVLVSNTTDCLIRNNFIQVSNIGDAAGILIVQGVSICKILNNSLRLDSQGQNSAAIKISNEASYLTINSNIFANMGIGYALSCSNLNFSADYNDYYSFGEHHFLYLNQQLDSLSDWQAIYPGDIHSLCENPFFSSSTNLTCNQSLINNTALASPDVLFDIDNLIRPATPDMGAREFNLCALDAGINSFVGLTHNMNPGVQNVTVELQNHGTITLTSCTIKWKKNGISQPNFIWAGSLLPGESILVTLGTFTIVMAQTYDLEAWTSNPNGGSDCKPSNDLLKFLEITSVLCGTYTIGGTNPDFNSFGEAVQILNLAGVSCPVLFLIRDGGYQEQFTIGSINGADSVNRITFRGENLDSSQVILSSGPSGSNYTINLENTSWISFENISIIRSSNTISNQAVIIKNSSHISFKSDRVFGLTGINCLNVDYLSIDKTLFSHDNWNYMGVGVSNFTDAATNGFKFSVTNSVFKDESMLGISAGQVDEVTIQNNAFTNIFSGISMILCTPTIIQSNVFQNLTSGINLNQSEFCVVSDNVLKNINNAIQLSNSFVGANIWNNRIQNLHDGNGIFISNCDYANVYTNYIHGDGISAMHGIYLNSTSNYCKIIHNAVSVKSKDVYSSAINFTGTGNTLTVKNNSFANYGKGNAMIISALYPSYEFDYNNYWAAQNRLFLLGQTMSNNFQAYQQLTGYDTHSYNVDPYYSSPSVLVSNHTALNNSAVFYSPYLIDIDSVTRNNSPDIGAKEFDICSVDVGINRFIGLEHNMSPGSHDLVVELQNHGLTTVTNCLIHFAVNEVYQFNIGWSGTLYPGQHFQVNLSSLLVVTGENYSLKAWTSNPNNLPDCNNYNDTGSFSPLTTPLCGTYTIGGLNPDFQNFAAAAEILEYAGVSCPVVFLIRNGTYNEQLDFKFISGTSAVNTITFKGESMDSSAVILQIGSSQSNFVMRYSSTSWINWEYVTFRRPDYSAANCIWIEKSAHNNSFKSCQFQAYQGVIIAITNKLLFDKCYFSKVPSGPVMEYGIYMNGGSGSCTDISITNSEFNGLGSRVIAVQDCEEITVTNNWIHDSNYGNESIYLLSVDTAIISFNKIENQTEGIKAVSSQNISITDNIFSGLEAPAIYVAGSDIQIIRNRISDILNASAITLGTCSNIQIFNNFVHVNGLANQYGINITAILTNCSVFYNSFSIQSTGNYSAALNINYPGTNLSVKNNILANFGGGPGMLISFLSVSFECDYNDYFSTGSVLIQYGTDQYSQLIDWQLITGLDPNSFAFNPFYISSEDLRPQQREINGAGIAIAAISQDIDNQLRDENSPDIGADEFTIDFGILELVEPTLNCYLTSSDSIVVLIKQFGDIPLLNIEIAYQVNNGQIFYDTIPGSTDNDLVFTFSETQNMAGYGTYVFKIWLINQFDDNINNDTLIVARHSSEVPQLTAGYLPGCANSQTQFFSTGTLQLGTVDYYYWDFGDGQTATGQNPVHVYDTSGTYHVHLYAFTQIGCYNDTVFDALIFYTPIADFSASSICLGDTMLFQNSSIVSQGSLTYSWDFGDGATSQAIHPTHYYSQGSIYGVELIAYSQNGCSDTMVQYFQVMPPPIISFSNLPASICNADPAFVVQVSPPGGTIAGNGILGNSFYPSLAGPGPSSLSYEYTNSFGCTNMISNTIAVHGSPNVSLSSQGQVACKGDSTGNLAIIVVPGTSSGYSILWSNGMSTQFISGLPAGTYSVTVNDSNNCKDSATYSVQEPVIALDLKITKTNATCFEGTNGTLFAQGLGGNPPYPFFHWSNGSASSFIMNLSAGTYTVTMVDVLGCAVSKTDTIKYPPQIDLAFAVSDAVCPGEASGEITPTVTNTISFPISYLWSTGATTEILSNVPEGYYFLTVTDAHNCSYSDSTYISQPPPWVVYAYYDSTLCYGSSDGAIYLMPTGSNPPFTDFLWENGVVDSFLTNIPAGYYNVTITDHMNCLFTDSFEVLQPDSICFTFNVVNNLCFGDSQGSIDLAIQGGSGNYPVIYWSSGDYTEDISSLQAGIYTVTLSDSHHCSAIASTEVFQPDSVQLELEVTPVNCFGESTGAIGAFAQGGISPYVFEWSTGSNSQEIINLEAGIYTITLIDKNACITKSSVTVPTASEIAIEREIINPTCMFSSDAVINITPYGGLPPFSYSWSNGENFQNVEGLAPGEYQVLITDSALCQKSFDLEIFRPSTICIDPPLLFSPNGDGINDYWLLDGLDWTPFAVVTIFDRWGRITYSCSGNYIPWDGRFESEFVPSDAYFYVIDFGNGYPPVSGKVTVVY